MNRPDSTSLQQSIQEEEAEFEGDPSLELVSEEKVRELERPAWATKIIKSYVQTKEKAEEENRELSANDEELEEEVFRKRKVELTTAGTGDGSSKDVPEEFDMSLSEELTDESGCASDEIPSSPRAAPVGKDNDVGRVRSRDTSEVGASTGSGHSTPERVFKVVFVGDSGVDFQIRTMTVQGRYIALQLWDTAGQERFRSITKQYFRKADGVVVFYDVTMEASFLHIKNWMLSVEEGTDEGTAIMIVGNKTDLIEDENGRPVKSQDGMKLAEEYNALYTETSAKTGFNIQESMEELAKMLQDREDEYMQSVLNL
ncbi:EF-hand calcium-binding domain-containing protein 4B, partial [Acropora cervicornis]